ncbi:MAG: tripartite tricarboxylate transporter TctB family protein [Alphaproteobacteria bacterium]
MLVERLWAEPWRRADSVLALALILLSTVVIWAANRLPPPFFDPLGSAAVPRFVAWLLIVLALAVLGRCLLTPAALPAVDAGRDTVRPAPLTALGALIASILYVGLMQAGLLGFAPASALFIMALGALLSRGERRAFLWMIPLAIIVGYGLNYLLTGVFYIDLPQRSIFGSLFGGGGG